MIAHARFRSHLIKYNNNNENICENVEQFGADFGETGPSVAWRRLFGTPRKDHGS